MATSPDQPIVLDREYSPGLVSAILQAGELVNTITHGIGLVLSIAGAVVLIVCALSHGDVWRIVGCGIFATTLIAVYAASTLSHGCSSPRWKYLFQILDQAFIYLLIAGTYTPFSLAYLRTGWWWLFLGLMWTIAVCGFLAKILFFQRVKGVVLWTYVLLGWLPIIPAISLIDSVPNVALWWMLIGGLCYTVGTVFLICDIRRLHFHGIWHTLVMAGSTCHFFAILLFVAYPPINNALGQTT